MSAMQSSVRWAFDFALWKPTEAQWILALSCIQREEASRIARFVFQKDAKSSLIGRLMMRKYIAESTNIPYAQITFDRDAKGKPFLVAENTSVKFNVSHHGSYAVLAGEGGNVDVGIDVMKLEYTGGKNLDEFFRLMNRQFSPKEWANIKGENGSVSDSVKLATFCRHWALKESYVKATGTGITVDLQNLSFQPKSQLDVNVVTVDTLLYIDNIMDNNFVFQETLLDDEHCVSVAVSKQCQSVGESTHFKILTFDDVMNGCQPLVPEDPVAARNFFNKPEHPN